MSAPKESYAFIVCFKIHYERYDRKFGKDGTHDPLNWEECSEAVERFKEDVIFADMVETEAESKSMMDWLKFLHMHTFTPRHFENEVSGMWNRSFTGMFSAGMLL